MDAEEIRDMKKVGILIAVVLLIMATLFSVMMQY